MIACLYGRSCAPFVEPIVRDLQVSVTQQGERLLPITIERATAEISDWRPRGGVDRLYVLPFDVPRHLPPDVPNTPAALARKLFPAARELNSFDVQEICWDKPQLMERWLSRGLQVPESLLSSSVEDATEFVRAHEWAVLKSPRSAGGHGHYIVSPAADGLIAEARGQRYELELVPAGARSHITDRRLRYAGPFFLQRLVAEVGARNVMRPAQHLRAYVVDGQLLFWTERYRARYSRLSDWIVGTDPGARHRFLFSVGEEARKLALRAAEVIGMRFGAVDLLRTNADGAFVLSANSDGHHMAIDRGFKQLPEFRDCFDLDRFLAEALVADGVRAQAAP
jgi:glutathione synthase/RimK-type ligase-like ATP-grasp enzyme